VSTAATDEAILAATGRVADPLRPLPFPFAKRHGVLVRGFADDSVAVVVPEGASPPSVAPAQYLQALWVPDCTSRKMSLFWMGCSPQAGK